MVRREQSELRRVVLVGRGGLLFEGLDLILRGAGVEVPGIYSDIAELGEVGMEAGTARGAAGTLILIDIGDEPAHTYEQVALANELFPDMPSVVLADRFSSELLRTALMAGASGLLLKDTSGQALVQSLKLVLFGQKVFPTHLAEILEQRFEAAGRGGGAGPRDPALVMLSGREEEILGCLLRGETNKEIAKRLQIAEGTVKVHVKRLLRKIRVTNRTQAAIWGLGHRVSSSTADENGVHSA